MKRHVKTLFIPLLIAGCCVGLLAGLQWWRPAVFAPLEIAAGDHLFLHEDGPHLGRRAVHKDIVLVMVDRPTMRVRGGVLPSYAEDLQLYQQLTNAGAKVVADTRMVAAADAGAMIAVRPLLEGMRKLRDDGSLMRDIWTPVSSTAEDRARWMPNVAPIVMNMHPSVSRVYETRFSPLVAYMNAGPVEAMPLEIHRAYYGEEFRDSVAVDEELYRCGIFVSWSKRENMSEYRMQAPPFYRVGDLPIHWYAFETGSGLVPPAAFLISYEAPPSRYHRFSYQEVLEGNWQDVFADKIVIVGRDAQLPSNDQTYTVPTSMKKVAIAEVVAAATQTLLDKRFPRELPSWAQLLLALTLVVAVTFVASRARPIAAVVISLVVLALYFAAATMIYRQGWFPSVLLVPVTAVIAGGLGGAYQLLLALRARSRIVDLFGRYVPRAVVSQLMQKPELETLVMGGVRRDVSVMFADIRGFTTFSEHLEPETVLHHLNSLLDGMVACTFAAEGTLDKFIGDAILVLFNAPLEQPDHVQRAVATALKIQAGVLDHPSGLSIGIGIHSGDAVVGNIGTPERMESTAIGTTVNIASRLCDAAQPGEIVVSASVARQLDGLFVCEARPPIRVKGIQHELEVCVVRKESPKC